MLKDRLIFTLLYGDHVFNLSRNFSLQRVGDLKWVQDNYAFNSIARSIDELVILDVSRGDRNIEELAAQVELLAKSCFVPIAAGGGIRTIDHAHTLFRAGADKVVLNSLMFTDPELVRDLSRSFGGQSIVASIDYRIDPDGSRKVFTKNGTQFTGMALVEALNYVVSLNIGEVYLTSINNDGTGNGFDIEGLRISSEECEVPTIASGGAGNYKHLIEGLRLAGIRAVSTANLFNFMGDGIREARELMVENGAALCMWREKF